MRENDIGPGPDQQVPAELAEDVAADLAGEQRDPRPEIAGQERVAGVLPVGGDVEQEQVPEGVREAEKGTDPTS